VILVLPGFAPCVVTFVRHGETVANATGRYSNSTLNSFSAKGAAEVAKLTKFLESAPRFDLILVSPAPRTLATVAPYLAATHQKALVWPLLYECCTARRPAGSHPTSFSYGSRIEIPKQFANLFVLMPSENKLPDAPGYNEGLAQVDSAVQEFRSKFERPRVLVVGHSGMGGHFIHEFTGVWHKLDNAAPYTFNLGR